MVTLRSEQSSGSRPAGVYSKHDWHTTQHESRFKDGEEGVGRRNDISLLGSHGEYIWGSSHGFSPDGVPAVLWACEFQSRKASGSLLNLLTAALQRGTAACIN